MIVAAHLFPMRDDGPQRVRSRIPRRNREQTERRQPARQIVDRLCGGSVEELLVGLVDNQVLQPKQLQRLAEKIASRKEKTA